jgi:hypothetical protein
VSRGWIKRCDKSSIICNGQTTVNTVITFGFHNICGISWRAEELSPSHEEVDYIFMLWDLFVIRIIRNYVIRVVTAEWMLWGT